jgi:hypothetical protein
MLRVERPRSGGAVSVRSGRLVADRHAGTPHTRQRAPSAALPARAVEPPHRDLSGEGEWRDERNPVAAPEPPPGSRSRYPEAGPRAGSSCGQLCVEVVTGPRAALGRLGVLSRRADGCACSG